MPEVEVSLSLNGEAVRVRAWPMERLLDLLRVRLGLTGSKEGCGEGECGACAVLVDGELTNACLVPALQVEGAEVWTIEGLSATALGRALGEAFVACNGAQCGICTPGVIVASKALLDVEPAPTPERVREALAGNLCRCTGYERILEAVVRAARATGGGA